MNKPTKAQRHAIYKKAMEYFKDSGDCEFLCVCIGLATGWAHHSGLDLELSKFPELLAQKPAKVVGEQNPWWRYVHKNPSHQRRRALQRCIDLSAPTPRKTVGKTAKTK